MHDLSARWRHLTGGIPPRRAKCVTIGPYITTSMLSAAKEFCRLLSVWPISIAQVQLPKIWNGAVSIYTKIYAHGDSPVEITVGP